MRTVLVIFLGFLLSTLTNCGKQPDITIPALPAPTVTVNATPSPAPEVTINEPNTTPKTAKVQLKWYGSYVDPVTFVQLPITCTQVKTINYSDLERIVDDYVYRSCTLTEILVDRYSIDCTIPFLSFPVLYRYFGVTSDKTLACTWNLPYGT